MAPLPTDLTTISDLSISSNELDSRSTSSLDLPSYLSSLSVSDREALANPQYTSTQTSRYLSRRNEPQDLTPRNLSPIQANSVLTARTPATTPKSPGSGTVNPDAINNKGIQALFALIGVGFVVSSIWFFFWAKNGGFQWRKGDWEDYKSTVLRRKGPNGTTLSNATKSTRLGGGSVVGSGYSDTTGLDTMTELSSEAPIIKEKNRKSKGKGKKSKETTKERKIRETKEAEWEGGADQDVRAYRHEKPARVGGLNKDSDAQFYGTDYSETDPSVTQHTPRSHGRHHSSSRHASPEKRERERERAGGRRDFSYTVGQVKQFAKVHHETTKPPRYHSSSPTKISPRKSRVPSSYAEPLDFNSSDLSNQGTKSYHHPIPELSGGRGHGNGGFRRGRADSLDD